MSDTTLLQALIDGQTEIKKAINNLGEKLSQTEERLSRRIDSLGNQLNELDEDAPTNDDLEELDIRVNKLEKHVFPVRT